jgi:hypothetical protein
LGVRVSDRTLTPNNSKKIFEVWCFLMAHTAIPFKRSFFKLLVLASCFATTLIFLDRGNFSASANDKESLDAGFRQMYNLNFPAAHAIFENWKQLHPSDPLGPAANAAAYLFGEFERLHILEIELFTDNDRLKKLKKPLPDPEIKAAFQSEIEKAHQMASEALTISSEDTNALFARVLCDGLRGNYAGLIEKNNGDALDYLKSSRSAAEKLLDIDPAYYDAYLAIGIENYILGLRSAPVRWFLKLSGAKTNKNEGLAKLQITAEKGHFMAPYARLLLAIAAIRDGDRKTARTLLADLVRQFPQNNLYRMELARL